MFLISKHPIQFSSMSIVLSLNHSSQTLTHTLPFLSPGLCCDSDSRTVVVQAEWCLLASSLEPFSNQFSYHLQTFGLDIIILVLGFYKKINILSDTNILQDELCELYLWMDQSPVCLQKIITAEIMSTVSP